MPTNVYAFIDSQNLRLGVRSQGWELDFARFRVYLEDKFNVSKAFLFIGYVEKNKNLYHRLTGNRYNIIFKPTVKGHPKSNALIKGNVDAELVLHTMIQWNNFEEAIIVSGDGDFHCLIEHLECCDKLHKIIVPNHKYSSLLKKFANKIVQISSFKEKVERKER